MIDTLDINFLDFYTIERFLKGDKNLRKSDIQSIISYFDQTGDWKISFNEFVLALTPTTRAPRIEDMPEIISYSPRKAALEDSLPPKFDDSLPKPRRKSFKKKNKSKSSKSKYLLKKFFYLVFPLRTSKISRMTMFGKNSSRLMNLNSKRKNKVKSATKTSK